MDFDNPKVYGDTPITDGVVCNGIGRNVGFARYPYFLIEELKKKCWPLIFA